MESNQRKISRYLDLAVWQKSVELVSAVYTATSSLGVASCKLSTIH